MAEELNLVPTEGMATAAKRALKWKEEGRAGGTAVGLARAHQLANREKLSERTVLRMFSFFSRHEPDKQATGFNSGEEGYPSKGRVAWDLWGGDGGYTWSRTKRDQIMARRGKSQPTTSKALALGNTMEDLINYLKATFASEYAFYLKAQNFHWNIEGDDFVQLHDLFGEIYDEVGDAIDPFAENIRKIQAYTPASFSALNKISAVGGVDQMPMYCDDMLQSLLTDSENMEQMFAMAYEKADANKKYGLANFLADRQDAHAKHSWKLRTLLVPDADEMTGEND
jgi:DNA-binding ferritin-like protein